MATDTPRLLNCFRTHPSDSIVRNYLMLYEYKDKFIAFFMSMNGEHTKIPILKTHFFTFDFFERAVKKCTLYKSEWPNQYLEIRGGRIAKGVEAQKWLKKQSEIKTPQAEA